MTNKQMPEALRLAQILRDNASTYPQTSEDEAGGYVSEFDYELANAAKELERQHAEIERLRADLMKANANLFEVRKLLDERPAMNQGLVLEYQKWTGKVYSLDFMNAQDAALQSTKEQP